MNRTEDLLKLRPKIKTLKLDLHTSTSEQFQNDTLRPILKFQHDLLIQNFQNLAVKRAISFDELKPEEKEAKLDLLFQKELAFKNQMLGIMVGMFTIVEYQTYREDFSSYNRRIITMLKQRIMSVY